MNQLQLPFLFLLLSLPAARGTWYSENVESGADIILMDLRWPWWPSGTYFANWTCAFTTKQPELPALDKPAVTNVRAVASAGQIAVSWEVPPTASPAFSCKVEVFDNPRCAGEPKVVKEVRMPGLRDIVVTAPAHPATVRLTVTDVFDQAAPPVVAEPALVRVAAPEPVAGPTIAGLAYELFYKDSMRPVNYFKKARQPGWMMGPFIKQAQPVLRPAPGSTFHCPVLGKEVAWEAQNVYNPAAVVRNGRVYLLYRADDQNPELKWGRTCRIGMAWSEDGTNFNRHPTPVLYPDNDAWKPYEWEGGCEDLHIVEDEGGTCYLNYTTWNGSADTVSVATSADLVHWTKHGPAFRKAGRVGGRSGVVVSRRVGDRLVATKLNGKYWMVLHASLRPGVEQ